jgi:hypothetical protein
MKNNKIRLIIGNSPSHLLVMAKTMAFRKNYQIIIGSTMRKFFDSTYEQCSRDTEVVIIQELPIHHLHSTVAALASGEICIKRKGSEPYLHSVDIVITCICKVEWLMKDPCLLKQVTLMESRVFSLPDVEPVRVPESIPESIGNQFLKDQVIILSLDKATGCAIVTTWGHTPEDKEQADRIGQAFKSSQYFKSIQS